ncbi:HIT family protein [Candidatus Uhrbacteria bacterium]|nr:HIT family protein [Candidatus Uhrbacteria bacterium]
MPFPKPPKASIIYQDSQVYACLAMYPITRGHTVVVWKRPVRDLHLLSCEEYEHLMHVVDAVRDALQQELHVEKVYLIYMDEARHVHWHLVPRYNEQGFNVFAHAPKRARTFPLAPAIRTRLRRVIPRHKEFYGGTR